MSENPIPPASATPPQARGTEVVRSLLLNVALPLGILASAGALLVILGTAEPQGRSDDDRSYAGRMRQLTAAEVLPVRSLDDFGGELPLQIDGTVVPYREIQIAAEVTGRIIEKDPNCEAGNYVQAGQPLFRIDPEDYRLEIERLTKQRKQESEAIEELEQEIRNVTRLITNAEEQIALRERELRRLEGLPAGFASQAELDQAQQQRLTAVNNQLQLENQLQTYQSRRARLEAAEQLAATQLAVAELNLQRTEIRAPVSGVIVREDAQVNSFVQRGSILVLIEETSRAEVKANLRMDQLYWVLNQDRNETLSPSEIVSVARDYQLPRTRATIQYQVAGRENELYQWEGYLERYDGIGLDPQSRTVPVRVMVDRPQRYRVEKLGPDDPEASAAPVRLEGPSALVRGMYVRVILHVQPRAPLVVVPAVALQPGNRLWHFVPDPSVLELAPEEAAAAEPSPGADPRSGPFQMEDWIAGRVEIRQRVRPISPLPSDNGAVRSRRRDEPRFWICEIGDGQLFAGDAVIVSPLPAVRPDGSTPVRVLAEQLDTEVRPVNEASAAAPR